VAIEYALDGYAVPILETCKNASSRTVPLSLWFVIIIHGIVFQALELRLHHLPLSSYFRIFST
jgi:hypothetical protein